MSRDSSALKALAEAFPHGLHQIPGPDGELVWAEMGINPDDVFADKRKTDWPFSQIVADLVCQHITEGASLNWVCQQPGFPSANVLYRWRRTNADFRNALKLAYADRADCYREKILELIEGIDTTDNLAAARLKIDVLFWLCGAERVAPEKKKSATWELVIK